MPNLEKYTLVYEITYIPYILYAATTNPLSPFEFGTDFEIPESLKGKPLECRFSLYDKEGSLVELTSKMVADKLSLISVCNLIPLKMIDKLLNSLVKPLQQLPS